LSYQRIIEDTIRPVPLQYFWPAVSAIVFIPLIIVGYKDQRQLFLVLALVAGLVTSAFLYAFVGYGLAGTGVMSRTLAAQNVYFSIFIGLSVITVFAASLPFFSEKSANRLTLIFQHLQQFALSIFVLATLVLFVALIVATSIRSREWIAIWTTELRTISSFPYQAVIDDIHTTSADSTTVVVQIDEDISGTIFGAEWELQAALSWNYPIINNATDHHRLRFKVAREAEWSTVWNGNDIIQKWCNSDSIITSAEAGRVKYVQIKTNGDGRLYDYPNNITTGCRQGSLTDKLTR